MIDVAVYVTRLPGTAVYGQRDEPGIRWPRWADRGGPKVIHLAGLAIPIHPLAQPSRWSLDPSHLDTLRAAVASRGFDRTGVVRIVVEEP